MQGRYELKIIYYPLRVLLGFLIFSEILYFIGPIDYGVENDFCLFFYLIILNYSLYWGFRNGTSNNLWKRYEPVDFSIQTVQVIIISALIVYLLNYLFQLQIYSISVFIQKVLFAVQNSGDVYLNKLESSTPTSITYVFMILSPITLLGQSLGIYYWKRLGKIFKWMVCIILFLEICLWLTSGTRKGIFDVFVIVLTMLVLSDPQIVLDKKRLRKYSVFMMLGGILFIGYFIISNLSRYGLSVEDFTEFDIDSVRPFYQSHFPFVLNMTLSNVTGYLCQGYRALSIALNDFIYEGVFCYTFGLGSSWFNINIAENILNIDSLPDTYQGYLATHYDIDEMVNWHTLYLWLANDFTFIGTPFVIYGLGYLFSCVWIDALQHRNEYAAPMSALCVLIIVYAFANNQVISFNFVSFFVLIVLYLTKRIKRKRFEIINQKE